MTATSNTSSAATHNGTPKQPINLGLHLSSPPAPHSVALRPMPYPSLRAGTDDVLLHVRCTGICGSDVHLLRHGGIGEHVMMEEKGEICLGHEAAGVVIELAEGGVEPPRDGSGRILKVGDRVAIEPGVSCLACHQCLRGRYNLCPQNRFVGIPDPFYSHGTLRRYMAHPAKWLHKIPDSMSFADAALVEPISVGLGGVRRSGLKLGQPALICGAGPIGLVTLALAKAAGAHPCVVTDIDPAKLELAREQFGADAVLKVDPSWDGPTLGAEIRKVFVQAGGEGVVPEVALECTGAQSSFFGANYALYDGGVLMQLGNGHDRQLVPFQSLSMREIDVRFLFRYTDTWPTVIRLLTHDRLPGVQSMITHTFKLEEAEKAFEVAVDPKAKSVKIQIADGDD